MSSTEEQRVLELYKYYASEHSSDGNPGSQQRENEETLSSPLTVQAQVSGVGADESGAISSPDTTLTALCQLAAIRLGVQRAGISLIARQQQYILAESTRTLNLRDTTASDDPGDALWMGLTECNRVGNLCEHTVCLPPARNVDIPPCFTVLDLRDDPRFRDAPYVAGSPHMKFYSGTPITTARNFNIGSFWVLDSRLLPEFTPEQKRFQGTMASLVMRQLEMTREAAERQRAMRMGQALSDFVDGKIPIPRHHDGQHQDGPPPPYSHVEERRAGRHVATEETKQQPKTEAHSAAVTAFGGTETSHSSLATEESTTDDEDTPESGSQSSISTERDSEESINSVFARAAYLIREALDIHGCIFLGTALSYINEPSANPNKELNSRYSTPGGSGHADDKRTTETPIKRTMTWNTASSEVPAEILAYAYENDSSLHGEGASANKSFTPIDTNFLNELNKRYPSGTMWTFGEAGLITPTESLPPPSLNRRYSSSGIKTWKQQRESEAEVLRHHFPYVSQLIFAPLFDAALERSTTGCFAFNNRRSRILTIESEVVFLKSFVNNVGAEISRMNTIAADRSKSDFIGSISHELRSPLHGMLAAAEFLEETPLDSYQKSLIATQVSCGKTLLQVIEHVLDFSKINSLAKDELAMGEQSNKAMLLGPKRQPVSIKTDIAELCEEVVEGSVAGKAHIVQDIAALNSRPSSTSLSADNPPKDASLNALQHHPNRDPHENIAVLLDFDYQENWEFFTQPGALRRILMNVLGNALKYTDFGYVKVRLAMAEPKSKDYNGTTSTVSLSVIDTGKGISRSFLRTRLFRPFNQEDHLSTGCGLGLSIVKSLVETLNGTLEVQSQQGVGTTVRVNLPLVRETQNSSKYPTLQSRQLEHVISFPSSVSSKTVTTVSEVKYVDSKEHHPRADNLAVREQIKTSVVETMHSWLHMKMLDIEQSMEDADYLVILGDELSCLEGRTWKKKPKVIALLPHDSMRGKVEGFLSRRFDVFQTVAAPFGPRKLARVVAACEAGKIRNTTRPRSYLEPSPSRSSNVEAASTSLKANSDDDLLQIRGKRITNENGPPHTGLRTSPQPANTLEANHKQDPAADGPAINTKKPIHSVSLATNGVDNHRTKNDQYVDTESKPSIGKGRPRLLLVDDNKINLSLLETFVKKQKRSLHYDCAVNGLLALEAARKNTLGYDIIFMDVSMPGMDGLEATREIRKLERERVGAMGKAAAPPPALIVALTGLANGRDQADAFASGIDLFMTKPTKFKEIGSLIEKWCENESRRVEYR